MSLFAELKRRNVFRVAAAYAAAAWLLIQVVETVFPAFGFGAASVRVVTILLVIGLVPALVIAWVFEITPEGLKKEKDIERAGSIATRTGKQLDRIIMVVLALAMGYFAFDKFVLSESREASIAEEARQEGRSEALVESYGDRSIAVLPFVNMSDDASNEYFSDGISEELLNLLARIPGLRVISRSSAFSFKGKDLGIPEIARRLNVAHILEGSVRKAGGRVRVTAQLIEARSDTHLWSQTWDRTLDDVFAIQDDIAASVAERLETELIAPGGAPVVPSSGRASDPEAYDAFLEGRLLTHKRRRQDLESARELLERSLELDGNYAPAHAQLAIITVLLKHGPSTYGDLTLGEVRKRAIPHIDRALELDPALPEAHGANGLLALNSEEYENGITHVTKALELNPNYADALNWLYISSFSAGHYKEAFEALERLLVVDPLSVAGRVNYSVFMAHRGRIEAAHEMADSIAAQNAVLAYRSHGMIASDAEGKLAVSAEWYLKAYAAEPDNSYIVKELAWRLSNLGLAEEAERLEGEAPYLSHLAQANWAQSQSDAQAWAQQDPENSSYILEWADALHLSGDVAAAQPLYETLLGQTRGRCLHDPFFSTVLPTVRAAYGRMVSGDSAGAGRLIELAGEDNRQRARSGKRDTYYFRTAALIAAVEGNREVTLYNLEQAMEAGLREPIALLEPAFDAVREDPDFKTLEANLARIMSAEKQQFLQTVCFSNPVPEQWQPLPATCAGVKPAGP